MTPLATTPKTQRKLLDRHRGAMRMVDRQISALFLDVDGTLLDLASTPDAVRCPTDWWEFLRASHTSSRGRWRSSADARSMTSIVCLRRCACARAEFRRPAQIRVQPGEPIRIASAAIELPASLRSALSLALARFHGILIENKGFSVAVDYRLNPKIAGSLRDALRNLIAAEPWRGLEIHVGYCMRAP